MDFHECAAYGGMALMPSRIGNLVTILPAIVPQLDHLHIHLNGGDRSLIADLVDPFLDKVSVSCTKRNQGDAEKIRKIGDAPKDALYFTFDDDLVYPLNYVEHMRNEMSFLATPGILCVHGAIFNPNDKIQGYAGHMQMFDIEWESKVTRRVMIPGTGTACTALSALPLSRRDCTVRNMYDDWLACTAAEAGVPVYTICRPKGWLLRMPSKGDDICSSRDDAGMEALMTEHRDALKTMYAQLSEPVYAVEAEAPVVPAPAVEEIRTIEPVQVAPAAVQEEKAPEQPAAAATVAVEEPPQDKEAFVENPLEKFAYRMRPADTDVSCNYLGMLERNDLTYALEELGLSELQAYRAALTMYTKYVWSIARHTASGEVRKGPTVPRGIVTVAGGDGYFPPAYVMIRSLRAHGCTLPVQVFHLGPAEKTLAMTMACKDLDVEFIDAFEVMRQYDLPPFEEWPVENLEASGNKFRTGWPIKALSLLACKFDEVLFLDSDNVPVADPTYLFDTPEYKEHGAMFWPDYKSFGKGRKIWGVCGVEPRIEVEFESGQMLIDRNRRWAPLLMAAHLNANARFYYQYIHGDKDTFHMAWHICKAPYYMIPTPIEPLQYTMCQHDPSGKRIFQHRNATKWSITNPNPCIDGFWQEEQCIGYLREYLDIWREAKRIKEWSPEKDPKAQPIIKSLLSGNLWKLDVFGSTIVRYPIQFLKSHKVIGGEAMGITAWGLGYTHTKGFVVQLYSERFGTFNCVQETGTTWVSREFEGQGKKIRLRYGN